MAVGLMIFPLGLPLNLAKGMTNASKSPRGVRGFKLNHGTFGTWKVQGKIGGYTRWTSYLCLPKVSSMALRVVSLTLRAVF
jgi:hypothetical protein